MERWEKIPLEEPSISSPLDYHTHYCWIYPLERKNQVFSCIKEWKAEVENQCHHQLKMFRTDNGGEFTSTEFQDYLNKCGVRYEVTIPNIPEQNGSAKRLNHKLVETTHSMQSFHRVFRQRQYQQPLIKGIRVLHRGEQWTPSPLHLLLILLLLSRVSRGSRQSGILLTVLTLE